MLSLSQLQTHGTCVAHCVFSILEVLKQEWCNESANLFRVKGVDNFKSRLIILKGIREGS